MQTTTLKLSEKLKARIAVVASRTGRSAHAFMVEAIERETGLAERRRRFIADARAAERDLLRTGLGHEADEVHAYLEARAKGQATLRPKPRRWRG